MPSNTNEVSATPAFRSALELCETILEKNRSMRALGALLSSARLSDFDPGSLSPAGKDEAEDRQAGLGQLVELIVGDQERAIALFREEYLESDERWLQAAADTLKMVKAGCFIGERIPASTFKEIMEGLHMVIERDAGSRPVAEAMVEAVGQYAPLSVCKVAKGGA